MYLGCGGIFRAVTHSSSYLPFIFASSSRSSNAVELSGSAQEKREDRDDGSDDHEDEDDSVTPFQLKGRRMFNDRGEEVDPKAFKVSSGSCAIRNDSNPNYKPRQFFPSLLFVFTHMYIAPA